MVREKQKNKKMNGRLIVILTSVEVALFSTAVSSPTTFQEAEKLFFLKKSRLKGPKSFVLAVMTSMT